MIKYFAVFYLALAAPSLAQIKSRDIKMFEEISSIRIPNTHYRAISVARKHLIEHDIDPDQYDLFVEGKGNIVVIEFNYRTEPGHTAWRATQKGCPRNGRPVCKEYVIDSKTLTVIRYRDVPF